MSWATEALVLEELGSPWLSQQEADYLSRCVAAANRAVALWRPDLTPPSSGITGSGPFSTAFSAAFERGRSGPVAADPLIVLGTCLLAARWFQRRGGDQAGGFSEFGGPLPVIDHDLSVMLRIGRFAGPLVG